LLVEHGLKAKSKMENEKDPLARFAAKRSRLVNKQHLEKLIELA
jgi:hypothetical protein